jgi:hypothetical protein
LSHDKSSVQDDLVKLVNNLGDDVVDRGAQAEKRAVVGGASSFDSIEGRSAIEDELGGLKLNVPRLILNAAIGVREDDSGGPAAVWVRISPIVGPWVWPLVVNDSA